MISENKKAKLLELLNEQEDELLNFIHLIEDDQNIPTDSFIFLENQSNKLYRLISSMREEVYYT